MNQKIKKIISSLLFVVMIVTIVGGVLTPGKTSQAAGTIKHVVGLLNVGDTTIVKGTTTPPSSYGNTDTATLSLSGSQQYIVGAFVLSNSKIDHYEILLKKGNTIFKYSPTETKNHAGLTTAIVNAYNKQDKTTYQTVNTEWNYIIDTNNLDTGKWTLESWAYTAAGSFCAGKVTINVGAKNISTYNHASCYEGAIKTGNAYNTVNKSYAYGTTAKFNFRLWAIHDQGLSGYAYKITSSNGGSYSSGSVSLNSIVRYDLDEYQVRENLKIGQCASLANSGCDGTIDFSKFKPGTYKIEITATPNKGNAFKVLQIDLTITGNGSSSSSSSSGSSNSTNTNVNENRVTFIAGDQTRYIGGTGRQDNTMVVAPDKKSAYIHEAKSVSTVTYNEMPKFSKTGYVVSGYSEKANQAEGNATYSKNSAPLKWTGYKNLYPVWSKGGVITYDLNGGEFKLGTDQRLQNQIYFNADGDTIILNPPEMARYGHDFVGFTLKKQSTTVQKTPQFVEISDNIDDSEKIYHAGDKVRLSELTKNGTDVTLYAVWDIHSEGQTAFLRKVYAAKNDVYHGNFQITSTIAQKRGAITIPNTVKVNTLTKGGQLYQKPTFESDKDYYAFQQQGQNFANAVASQLGIKNKPTIVFSKEETLNNTCGQYNYSKNTIYIYAKCYTDRDLLVKTIAHETYHAYQYQEGQKEKHYYNASDEVKYIYEYTFQLKECGSNNQHYIRFGNYEDYVGQYIEAEAKGFEALFNK